MYFKCHCVYLEEESLKRIVNKLAVVTCGGAWFDQKADRGFHSLCTAEIKHNFVSQLYYKIIFFKGTFCYL